MNWVKQFRGWMWIVAFGWVGCWGLVSCEPSSSSQDAGPQAEKNGSPDFQARPANLLFRLGFGSCNYQLYPQDYWPHILYKRPDVWLWGGDMIYADTNDMAKMKSDYDMQKSNPFYRTFRSHIPIIGIWDDHDFGQDNATSTYPYKDPSQQLLLDFLDVPANDPRRTQKGVYTSVDYPVGSAKLKIIMLDVRYFRGEQPGDILGDAQWLWLEDTLKQSKADIHFIVSGSQILRDDALKDAWFEFPPSQAKLYQLLIKYKVPGVIFLSGDIHAGEVSKSLDSGLSYPLYEFTSSGLTHVNEVYDLHNKYRVDLLREKNFSMIDFIQESGTIAISFQLFAIDGTLRIESRVTLRELQP